MRINDTKRRKGAAALELAVTLLPLMMIVMGIIESGRFMLADELLVNASREGARLAALGGSTIGTDTSTGAYEVKYRVRQTLTNAQINASLATITVSDLDSTNFLDLTSASVGDRIQVSVSVPFTQIAWFPPWFFGGKTLKGTSIMRKESP